MAATGGTLSSAAVRLTSRLAEAAVMSLRISFSIDCSLRYP
jgi:hypothetical protein